MKSQYHLSLGSNLGNRLHNLWMACVELCKIGVEIHAMSSVYVSQAWGMEEGAPDFYNVVIKCSSIKDEFSLLEQIKEIEKGLGRNQKSENGKFFNRLIDIDILLKEGLILNEKDLVIPHKELKNRRFVLIPLQEVSPELRLPGTNEKISDIIHACKDLKTVNKLSSLGAIEAE